MVPESVVKTDTKALGSEAEIVGKLASSGLVSFCRRLEEDFGDEKEERIREILSDIVFYCDGQEEYSLTGGCSKKEYIYRMVLDCSVSDGMRLGAMSLEEVSIF